jgi:hypothetical protein
VVAEGQALAPVGFSGTFVALQGDRIAWSASDGHDLEINVAAWVATPDFVDVPATHPYRMAIEGMRDMGIISGRVQDGQWVFAPDEAVKRAQFAKMICGAAELPVSEDMVPPFTDLGPDYPDNLYPHEYVAAVAHYGITTGVAPGLFAPYSDITRAQLLTMIVRAAQTLKPGLLETPPASYAGSLGSFDPIHATNARIAEYNGLFAGVQGFGPAWDPWLNATRGETAQILWNVMQRDEP